MIGFYGRMQSLLRWTSPASGIGGVRAGLRYRTSQVARIDSTDGLPSEFTDTHSQIFLGNPQIDSRAGLSIQPTYPSDGQPRRISSYVEARELTAFESTPLVGSLVPFADLRQCRNLASMYYGSTGGAEVSDFDPSVLFPFIREVVMRFRFPAVKTLDWTNCAFIKTIQLAESNVNNHVGLSGKLTLDFFSNTNTVGTNSTWRLQSLAFLDGCANLTNISVRGNRIQGIVNIGQFPNLTALEIGDGGGTGQVGQTENLTLIGLENCHSIQRLYLNFSRPTNTDYSYQTSMLRLDLRSDINGSLRTVVGQIYLPNNSSLVDLRASHQAITGINWLSPALSYLDISSNLIPPAGLPVLPKATCVTVILGTGSTGGSTTVHNGQNYNFQNGRYDWNEITKGWLSAQTLRVADMGMQIASPSWIQSDLPVINFLDVSKNEISGIVDLSGLLSLREFNAANCPQISGIVINNQIRRIDVGFSQNTIGSLASLPAMPPNLEVIQASRNGSLTGHLDLSAITVTMVLAQCFSCNLTSISFPVSGSLIINGNTDFSGNPNLTIINNLDLCRFQNGNFNFSNCPIGDRVWLFGSEIRNSGINISNTGIDQTNLDQSIRNLFAGRQNMGSNSGIRSLNIGGASNAVASGTYQQPAGYTHDMTEGQLTSSAASWTPKELLWILANARVSSAGGAALRSWTYTAITYN